MSTTLWVTGFDPGPRESVLSCTPLAVSQVLLPTKSSRAKESMHKFLRLFYLIGALANFANSYHQQHDLRNRVQLHLGSLHWHNLG